MKNYFRLILIQLNGLFPFLYPFSHLFKNFNYPKGIIYYVRDYFDYSRSVKKNNPFKILFKNTYPIYFDRFEEAGELPRHYFYQDIWAANKVYKSKVKTHYDLGSRINGFISHCVVFCKVVMLDIRPLKSVVPNLDFVEVDGTNMKNIKNNSLESISSLHAVEHFGLGRYGDPIDPTAYIKAIQEIQRVVKKGGDIYFSVPIGRQKLMFNAHRIFNPKYIKDLFKKCKLVEFSVVEDKDTFIEKVNIGDYVNSNYSCGLFHFKKL
ncbi:hypothetical protein COV24_05190 [candidate division WWE3 bacterium CG10_big_fil_rev_8_21_14_0_10_32_10]|uniref:DUF268 domain-containing protein n=1 Tax=candidate division WWE3 bacterium CG10_big_fil_rev_8_21_14_0_10_32_10 TaxID=1975090 RepID=A0A2H0R924_UNCKA|nr:MAG: hypothetical protein COV24_05190 [candidate division WWE3 bacterium CG10_big_fil_rev_8_21_14_0_10_32_10]